jgi:phosphocarrier protein
MITKTVTIRNRAGLHTRPSSMLVKEASKFKADFFIEKDGFEVNGKSIIGVMTLAAEPGAMLNLIFEGEDETQASQTILALFEDAFGEEFFAAPITN